MALPREPRQKMINLMYLVLTALLALNVSSEILNSFKTINQSLLNSNNTADKKNAIIFKSLQEKLADPKTRALAQIWTPKAQMAKLLSDEMVQYIESLKTKLIQASDYNQQTGEYDETNTDIPTKLLVDGKLGEVLHKKLKEYKINLLGIDPLINQSLSSTLPLDVTMPTVRDNSNNTWSAAYFRMAPTVAAITILSKFQNDIKNSEAAVVDFCHNKIGQVQVIYDQFQALAVANAQYMLPGQEFSITAGIGAFSKEAKPTITVDGSYVPLNADGVAEYKSIAGSPGTYSRKVNISFTKPDGTIGTVTKVINYVVGSPSGLNISFDAVKVMYVGLDNPISIGGGNGRGIENVKVSIDQGSVTPKGNGKYTIRVNKPGIAQLTVSDGKTTITEKVRVKTVPAPTAMVGASKGGRMRVNEFKAQSFVRAELENFVFEGVEFKVTGFTITFAGAGFPEFMYKSVAGNSLNAARSLIERAKPGSTITIDEIKAVGPGGTKTLTPIAFNLY